MTAASTVWNGAATDNCATGAVAVAVVAVALAAVAGANVVVALLVVADAAVTATEPGVAIGANVAAGICRMMSAD